MIYDCARIFHDTHHKTMFSVSRFWLNSFLLQSLCIWMLWLIVMSTSTPFTSDAMTCGYDRCLVFGISKIDFDVLGCHHGLEFSF